MKRVVLAADQKDHGLERGAAVHASRQIAYVCRPGGAPVRGENSSKAEIAAGRVGPDQSAATRKFD